MNARDSRSAGRPKGRRAPLITALAAACAAAPAGAAVGDSLWKFYADYAITVVEPISGVAGAGSLHLLIGSLDDSLYLVETKGAGAGKQAWATHMQATLSAAAALPDLNGDGRPDAVAGDELGLIAALNGADGKALWKFLTFGTVLSLAALPDVNGDGVADVAAGSENDTVYVLSGKPGSALGKSVWEFPVPAGKTHGPPVDPPKPVAKASANPFDSRPSGANSLALVGEMGKAPFGLAVGTNNDTVYCLGLSNGTIKWKTGLPGDVWKVVSFPDQNADGVEEVLLACGADAAYLLDGAKGDVIWSHSVTQGATTVAAAPDMDGDGKPDALIGDGNGTVHCVPGLSKGAAVKSAWMYSFGDASTITAIAIPGDLDKDGRAECVIGASNDTLALVSGKGKRLSAVGLGGQVNAVTAPGDVDGDGSPDWVAGVETGFAQAFSGGATVSILPRKALLRGAAARIPLRPTPLFARPGSGDAYDGSGRARPRIPARAQGAR